MTLEIPVVTFEKISKQAQEVIYNTLKNNISIISITKIRGRATIEVYKQKDFPIVEVGFPIIDRVERNRIDYSYKKIRLMFAVTINSINDTESIELSDLISYILESNHSDLHSGQLSKFNFDRINHSFKWDSKIEKKYYTSTIEFSVIWNGV